MYLVVSRWEALPGKEEEFEKNGREVAAMLRGQPGVQMVEVIRSNGQYVTVHSYADEATYDRLIQDENGAFAREMSARRVEEAGRWIGSDRGESLPR